MGGIYERVFILLLDKWFKDLGKKENHIPYIYEREKGWVIEPDHILSARIIGYDGYEIGCSDMLFRVHKITEEEIIKLINEMWHRILAVAGVFFCCWKMEEGV